jgi:hypothetical protein
VTGVIDGVTGVSEGVTGVSVGPEPVVGVSVWVRVGVRVWVRVGVGVEVAVLVAVAVGEAVRVTVGVAVEVGVAVAAPVEVSVTVERDVGDGARLAVLVGVPPVGSGVHQNQPSFPPGSATLSRSTPEPVSFSTSATILALTGLKLTNGQGE